MDLFASKNPDLLALVRAGADRSSTTLSAAWMSMSIEDMLTVDARNRPPGHQQDSRNFAVRYLGNQEGIVRAALRQRYPLSASTMPVAPLPYIRMWARKDSGAYQQEPQRYLVNKADRSVVDNEVLVDGFDRLVEASRISEIAPECERRARSGIKSIAVHVGYLPAIGDEPARPLLRIYWPHDVIFICHPSYPGEDEAAIFVAFRQSAENDSENRWLCYRRDFVDGDDGSVADWGPWFVKTWQQGREDTMAWSEYEGVVGPFAVLRLEPPDGGFWPAAERDSVATSDQLNASRSNLEYVTDLQAHSNLHIGSDVYDETTQAIGPDSVLVTRPGDTAGWLTPSPALAEMSSLIEDKQRAVGAARGNDPNAYSDKGGPAESGIARMVAQFPHELTLREAREGVRRFDERVCRVLLDAADAYDADLPAFGLDVRPRTELAPSVVFEDPSAVQSRALINLQEGAISPAEYAVAVGIASSVSAAEEAGYSNEARLRMKATPAPSVTSQLVEGDDASRV